MKFGPHTIIGRMKINNISKSSSINFGPVIQKGFQANSKFNTGEIVIGDEFSFGCSSNENNSNNDSNKEE